MSIYFRQAVAGPSRIPARAVGLACRAHSYSTEADSQEGQRPESESKQKDPVDQLSQMTLDPSPEPEQPMLERRGGRIFYRDWLRVEGEQYRTPQKGQKAKWLGGNVPYSSNPTFKPPPPLSNHLQDEVYENLLRGHPVADLAIKFNISKSRVSAIKKLKQVEDEFRRRSIPLQTAFLEQMEPLLGVRTPINPRTKLHDAVIARQIDMDRDKHPSTSSESLEEQRWEAGVGQEGAYGDRSRKSVHSGTERTAWEFREEGKAESL